mmetsp:Transcript_866/g.5421  ORF Transcript_866/g.5421 Transcript_866/m.5421 type:complete len:348 (-) Transcript_866:1384-2427(-)
MRPTLQPGTFDVHSRRTAARTRAWEGARRLHMRRLPSAAKTPPVRKAKVHRAHVLAASPTMRARRRRCVPLASPSIAWTRPSCRSRLHRRKGGSRGRSMHARARGDAIRVAWHAKVASNGAAWWPQQQPPSSRDVSFVPARVELPPTSCTRPLVMESRARVEVTAQRHRPCSTNSCLQWIGTCTWAGSHSMQPATATELGRWNKTGEEMKMAKKRQVRMFIGDTQRSCAKKIARKQRSECKDNGRDTIDDFSMQTGQSVRERGTKGLTCSTMLLGSFSMSASASSFFPIFQPHSLKNSLRTRASTTVVPSVHGTRYSKAGCPLCPPTLNISATYVSIRPTTYPIKDG